MSTFRTHDHYANQRLQPQVMKKPVATDSTNRGAAMPKTTKHPAAPNKQSNPKAGK